MYLSREELVAKLQRVAAKKFCLFRVLRLKVLKLRVEALDVK